MIGLIVNGQVGQLGIDVVWTVEEEHVAALEAKSSMVTLVEEDAMVDRSLPYGVTP